MFRENCLKKLTAGERAAVVALSLSGHSINQISRQIGCGRATVVLWKDRFDQTQDVQRKVGSGRPKITNPRQDQRMFNAARNKPITTSKEISGILIFVFNVCFLRSITVLLLNAEAAGVNVSIQTVIRRMKEINLRPRRAVREFFLTEAHAAHRLEFALAYRNYPADWWRNVIYSDEKTFG
jgi:transposase